MAYYSSSYMSSPRRVHRRVSFRRLRAEALEHRLLLATVTVHTDFGLPGELRTVVAAAVPGETIDFALGAGQENIVLTQGPLVLNKDLTVDGDNSGGSGVNVTLTGNGSTRVVSVDDSNGAINSITVTLRNLTITGGRATQGAGILSAERLTLDRVNVTGNVARQDNSAFDTFGGGILNNGTLTLQQSQVTQNIAQFATNGANDAFGGGIASTGVGSELHLIDSSVSSNEAIAGTGGGIFLQLGKLTMLRSSVSLNRGGLDTVTHGNVQRYDYGGGIAAYSRGPGGILAPIDMTITDSTITGNVLSNDGITAYVFPYGGGLFAKGFGNVNMTRSTISGNTVTGNNRGFAVVSRGGGMWIYGDNGGTLNVLVRDSTIDKNHSLREGGGIGVRGRENGPVRMTVEQSSISENSAGLAGVRQGRGGAIFHWANSAPTPGRSELRITNSRVSGNSSVDGSGGVILNTRGAVTYFDNSTLSGNSSGFNGGAISNLGTGLSAGQRLPRLFVRNTTISGNQALNNGGAIYSYDGTLEVFQSTISGNTAEGSGGAVYLATDGSYVGTNNEGISTIERSTITLNDAISNGGGIAVNYYHTSNWRNSIISGNSGPAGSENVYLGYNTTVSDVFTLIDGNAMLAPLADNGGPTRTHLPMSGSPVIDAADPTATGQSDQRGFGPRVVGVAMDMGSVEVGASAPITCDFDGNGQCDIQDIDALMMDIASGGNSPLFDLNGDSQVNLLDRNIWLQLAGAANLSCGQPYLLGDFNLDGVVDGSDFGIWNANKFTNTGRWSKGDANGDGVTDGSDFGIWNGNKFTNSCPGRPISKNVPSSAVRGSSNDRDVPAEGENKTGVHRGWRMEEEPRKRIAMSLSRTSYHSNLRQKVSATISPPHSTMAMSSMAIVEIPKARVESSKLRESIRTAQTAHEDHVKVRSSIFAKWDLFV